MNMSTVPGFFLPGATAGGGSDNGGICILKNVICQPHNVPCPLLSVQIVTRHQTPLFIFLPPSWHAPTITPHKPALQHWCRLFYFYFQCLYIIFQLWARALTQKSNIYSHLVQVYSLLKCDRDISASLQEGRKWTQKDKVHQAAAKSGNSMGTQYSSLCL